MTNKAMKSAIPSKFAVIQVSYGENNRHLYTLCDQEIEYFADEAAARACIHKRIVKDGQQMVALLEVKSLCVRKAAFEEIK